MYAGTKFNWFDQSGIATTTETTELDERTLFLTAITADKGTEELVRLYGDDFYRMYGRDLSFAKHGQPLLQAARVIDAGGELLVKRVVSQDATLSNIILVANVTEEKTQRTNSDGTKLYVDPATGDETTEANDGLGTDYLPSYEVTGATVKWTANTISNCATFEEVKTEADKLLDDENGVYPMIVITDIGRNADCKALRIAPDYDISRSVGFMFYRAYEFENTTSEENVTLTMNPSVKYRNVSYAINKYSMGELTLDVVDGAFDAYTTKLAEAAGITVDEMKMCDIINLTNCKGIALPNLKLDEESVDLSYAYGISLKSGSNGSELGDAPFHSENYADYIGRVFDGTYTDEIYDVDVHKIAVCCDANYPDAVKDKIVALADFREDFVFLRDLGLGLTTFEAIYQKSESLTKSKFVGNYMTSYDVIDAYTNKRINVTMMWDIAPILVAHFDEGAYRPMAGEVNGFTIDSAITGTVNYIPRKTPRVDQKDLLDDARINYATYYEYEGALVVDSLYTSQEEYTQLSYLNNVISIQEVMRAVRSACPSNRFRFTEGNDFTEYSDAVQEVLNGFSANFDTLNFVYQADSAMESQKIYYAAIEFSFNNWAQAEIFDLYAINATEISEE